MSSPTATTETATSATSTTNTPEAEPAMNLRDFTADQLNELLGVKTYNLKDRRRGSRTFILFGATKVGKTFQAYLLSKYGGPKRTPAKVLYINVERGESTLEGANITAVNCRTYASLKKILGRLKKIYDENKSLPFDYLFIDSATELAKVLVRGMAAEAYARAQTGDKTGLASTGNPNKPSLDMYNDAMIETDKTLMWLKDLPINIIFTAIDEQDKDENGYLFYMPSLSRGVRQSFYQYCDLIGYIGKDDQGFRYLQTDSTKTVKCGMRNPVNRTPVPPTLYKPDISDIFRHFKGEEVEFITSPIDTGAAI